MNFRLTKPQIVWLSIFFSVLAATLILDLVTKHLTYYASTRELIPGVLSIQFMRNFGIAFGWFSEGGVVLVIISLLMIIGALVWYGFIKAKKLKGFGGNRLLDVGMAFFIGGALGNLIDRIFFGYVRDFIRFDFVNFPIFNFADVFINVGLIILVIYLFKSINNSDIVKKTQEIDETGETNGENKSKDIGRGEPS